MKADPEVKMISAEAPILFAKGCDIFITELTMRAWIHAEENKRRTLQRSDIASALTKSDMFDFLIDIVPREEATSHGKRSGGGQNQAGSAAAQPVPPPPTSNSQQQIGNHPPPHQAPMQDYGIPQHMAPLPQEHEYKSQPGYYQPHAVHQDQGYGQRQVAQGMFDPSQAMYGYGMGQQQVRLYSALT